MLSAKDLTKIVEDEEAIIKNDLTAENFWSLYEESIDKFLIYNKNLFVSKHIQVGLDFFKCGNDQLGSTIRSQIKKGRLIPLQKIVLLYTKELVNKAGWNLYDFELGKNSISFGLEEK